MIAKSLIAAAAVATTMAVALPATEAQAKTKININVGLGFGGYGGGYYGGGYYGGGYGYGGHISCHKGRNIVHWHGFHNVHAVDCSLPVYKYVGWKYGHKFLVKLNRHGHLINVHKII